MMEYDISNRIGKALPARDMNRGTKKKKKKKEKKKKEKKKKKKRRWAE